jgi:hypothetical protein
MRRNPLLQSLPQNLAAFVENKVIRNCPLVNLPDGIPSLPGCAKDGSAH